MTKTSESDLRNPGPVATATRGAPAAIDSGLPAAQGLYDPRHEKDSCGVGFVVDMKGRKSHQIIEHGIKILENLEHRGAVGADPRAGDGAGMLVQIPHRFFAAEAERLGFTLPEPGHYAVGHVFAPRDAEAIAHVKAVFERVIADEGQIFLGWREVPTDNSSLGESVKPTEPAQLQLFVGRSPSIESEDDFERRLFILRKVVSTEIYGADPRASSYYPVSLSCRTIVYKGMFLADQLAAYYPDLKDERFESALALVHQRFSTNTFPTWSLSHPYRMVAHNGEINTLRGNVNWMAARQASLDSELYGNDISKLWPISYEGQSDTACLDNALEFLVLGGYSLTHAVMMLVPEAWAGNPLMDEQRRSFYEYHAAMMEPWDGPAAVAFTDGRQIGATLDRNGLRPARWFQTDDDLVVMASEMGVLPVPEEKIVRKWRLQPGRMLLIDLEQGRIVSDEEIKAELAAARPYKEWLKKTQLVLEDLPDAPAPRPRAQASLVDRQQAFGYTQEDVKLLLPPMATIGQEAVGSMGTDTPLSALSTRSKLLYTYFKQNFAQVTNPPIDPIREELVMSLVSFIGPRPNLFDLEGSSKKKRLEVRQPILTNEDLEKIRAIDDLAESHFQTRTLDTTYPAEKGAAGMADAIERLCERAEAAVHGGFNIVVLSDRLVGPTRIAIPALLATAAVHHHLIRKGLRTSVGLVVESGEPREIHHFAVLAGYGAEAINPYLAFETLESMHKALDFPERVDAREVQTRYIKSIGKGLLKVMSKMGISTYQSYCGAQIFDAVGLSKEFVDKFFYGTATPIGGVGLPEIAEETVRRHTLAFSDVPVLRSALEVGGEYGYRMRGEDHAWTPESVADLQHAVRQRSFAKYSDFAREMNEQAERLLTLRGLFRIRPAQERGREPVAIEDVEPASEIVKRFSTGAMSFGSISREAHETLAIAMNRIGGKSNTGEGGEEPERFTPLPSGDSKRSAIKQVASGRFGVSAEYLVNGDMIQIKVAQGAKPGEGGQLPGHKVDAVIARVRHSTPGVGLISPPPHHDIYSIEDLKQLIHDLKNVNPTARISVKLVSIVGVGTIAAGVAKAYADHVLISGGDGGTGASPITSVMHAGAPWEIGLAETHQTLVLNKLRGRIRVQSDGGIRTGRDVVMAALLGADEMGIATGSLIALGCIMMRKCHLNTCPVGVATQDPVLRARFKGQPEHVINYFFFVAEEVREIMAKLGFRTINEMIGRTDRLDTVEAIKHWKAKGLDLSRILYKPEMGPDVAVYHRESQDHKLDQALDNQLIAQARSAIDTGKPVKIETAVKNTNRTIGAMLSGEVAGKYGHAGLRDDTIYIKANGTAGQSFGAFLAKGITLELEGDANDYVGKGLSGGRLIVYPSKDVKYKPEDNIAVGNVVLYGAISGEAYFRGVAGERFAVRNSGAVAVAEGVGDHGCEYMTGGVVVVLGATGRNFAAGMSGGIAYVLDESNDFELRCNKAMVALEPVSEDPRATNRPPTEVNGLSEVFTNMNGDDALRLRILIERHMHFTNSSRAREIIAKWDEYLPKFVKVMPIDYRNALAKMQTTAEREAKSEIPMTAQRD